MENKSRYQFNLNLDEIVSIQESFSEFLDCHTSCFQTLLSVLGIRDKHVEVTKVLIAFDVCTIYEMIENLDLYGQICSICAKRAGDIFKKLQGRRILQKQQERFWN